MKISVITPTCFRPQMFRDMMESLYRTTQGFEIEHITLVDVDTQTFDFAIRLSQEYTLNRIDYQNYRVDFSEEKRGALDCWNRGLELCTGDIIVPSGDDHYYHDNWLAYALESHWEKLGGYGVVGMNDLAYGENQTATMFLFDRQYCKDHMGGIFAPPHYVYYCIDSEWNEKAKMLGKFYRDMRAKVEHRHSAHGKRPLDQHDQDRLDAELSFKDNRTFEQRKAQGFPVDWEPLI